MEKTLLFHTVVRKIKGGHWLNQDLSNLVTEGIPMARRKKKSRRYPSDLQPGDSAYIKGTQGRRYKVEVTQVPRGHVLVWVNHPVNGASILVTVPLDNLYLP